MSNKTLKIDYNYNFELVGISDNIPDYKLCWILNTVLNWRLEKKQDININHAKTKHLYNNAPQLFEQNQIIESNHTLYAYKDESNAINYRIITNKNNGLLLLPELPKINHLLLIDDWIEENKLTYILEKINQIPFISTAFKLNFKKFSNKQNLIFEYDEPKQNENSSYIRAGLLKRRNVRAND